MIQQELVQVGGSCQVLQRVAVSGDVEVVGTRQAGLGDAADPGRVAGRKECEVAARAVLQVTPQASIVQQVVHSGLFGPQQYDLEACRLSSECVLAARHMI